MIIYKTINLINNKSYIGKDHKNNPAYLGSGKLLKRAIKKYGKDNFKKEILEYCIDNDHLNECEIFWINKLDAVNSDNYYNIASGGNGGKLGNVVNEKRKASLIGHILSEETKQKIKEKAIGRKASAETKKKMSNSAKLRDLSYLHNMHKGSGNPRAFPIYQYSLDMILIKKWDYCKLAIESLGLNYTAISECLSGKQKTAGGFVWKKN